MVETLRNRGGGKGRGARDGERERERERILIQFCTVTAPPPKVIRCVTSLVVGKFFPEFC